MTYFLGPLSQISSVVTATTGTPLCGHPAHGKMLHQLCGPFNCIWYFLSTACGWRLSEPLDRAEEEHAGLLKEKQASVGGLCFLSFLVIVRTPTPDSCQIGVVTFNLMLITNMFLSLPDSSASLLAHVNLTRIHTGPCDKSSLECGKIPFMIDPS